MPGPALVGAPAMIRRLRLRRYDGQVYLDRRGLTIDWIGGIYLHKMSAPDPGLDLHDHPWSFASLILWGGYTEERCEAREACNVAYLANVFVGVPRGREVTWKPGSFHRLGLNECHRITKLTRRTCWTLVLRGPRVREWGFYAPDGWIKDEDYSARRRDLWTEELRP